MLVGSVSVRSNGWLFPRKSIEVNTGGTELGGHIELKAGWPKTRKMFDSLPKTKSNTYSSTVRIRTNALLHRNGSTSKNQLVISPGCGNGCIKVTGGGLNIWMGGCSHVSASSDGILDERGGKNGVSSWQAGKEVGTTIIMGGNSSITTPYHTDKICMYNI